ncbi:hypothetical protein LZP69_15755 [Shewanella sp. AS1]|uniref:hypothetical protein n=1 Tax=Shewanella sp. AS1 TaxID=2907626 RepID=UPI001F3F3010|nr:hypothetical protein [Shewanella sp. AS1]MCE9680607.1 hypothetical protein [Shewanella sp. AS1]
MIKSEMFNPNKSFLSLPIVWFTVSTFLLLSCVSTAFIIYKSNLELDLSYNGFNSFISIFKFPLGISALIIPIIALLAANHRSEQTKEQIRVTNAQNVFSNYYKHIEEFTKYLSERVDTNIDLRYAHSKFYPRASEGDYEIDPKLIDMLVLLDQLPNDLLKNQPKTINEPFDAEDLKKNYFELLYSVGAYIDRENVEIRFATGSSDNEFDNTFLYVAIKLIQDAKYLIHDVEVFCKFSINYQSQCKVICSGIVNLAT